MNDTSSRREFLSMAGLGGAGLVTLVGLSGCSEQVGSGPGDAVADYTVSNVRDEEKIFSEVSGDVELRKYDSETGTYPGKVFLNLTVSEEFAVNHTFWVYYGKEVLYSGVLEAGEDNYNISFLIDDVKDGGYQLKLSPPNGKKVSNIYFSFSEIEA